MKAKKQITTLHTLSATAFLANAVLPIYAIMVPLYAYTLGATLLELGLIGGAGGLLYSFAPFIMGSISDRVGRRRMISIALIINGAVCTSYLVVESPTLLIVSRIFEGLSWASLWPSIEAEMSLQSVGVRRGLRSYNVAWGIGAALGPIIAGVTATYMGIKGPFIFSLFAVISSIALSLARFKTSTPRIEREEDAINDIEALNHRVQKISLIIPLSSAYLYGFIAAVMMTFFPPYAASLGIDVFEVGLIVFVMGVARVTAFYISDNIQRRIGAMKGLTISVPLLALSPILILAPLERFSYYSSFILAGFFVGLTYAAALFLILVATRERRARSAGMFESSIGLGIATGPLISGFYAASNIFAPYIICTLVGLGIFFIQQIRKVR